MTTWVLMAGLPGTGKTALAGALARQLGGVVLSKDAVRASLFGEHFTDYSREQDDLCFRMVLEGASYLALHRQSDFIFLDGRTFSRGEQVDEAVQAAKRVGSAWRIIRTVCPDELAEGRLAADAARHPAKNRNADLYREMKARFEPIASPHLEVDTGRPLEACVRQAVSFLNGVRE